jgi:hypothetical protein
VIEPLDLPPVFGIHGRPDVCLTILLRACHYMAAFADGSAATPSPTVAQVEGAKRARWGSAQYHPQPRRSREPLHWRERTCGIAARRALDMISPITALFASA